jgi:hypothetical protein
MIALKGLIKILNDFPPKFKKFYKLKQQHYVNLTNPTLEQQSRSTRIISFLTTRRGDEPIGAIDLQ